MKYFLKTMRPEQWIKNYVVFSGLIFSGNLYKIEMIFKSISAFCLFSLISGATYVINDIFDIELDKKHYKKSQRPIASGRLSVAYGITGATLISVFTVLASFILNFKFGLIVVIYLIVNILYSIHFKKVVIIDVFIISLNFVLRVLSGVVVLFLAPTPWILICTIFLSLFLSLCKRRQEIVLFKGETNLHRDVPSKYSIYFLDQLIIFSSIGVVFSYILFAGISGKNINLMYTFPFVLYGVMRYLYLIYVENKLFLPTEALNRDKLLQACIILWLISVIIILYFL